MTDKINKDIILYGSYYGTTRRYAEKLSELTGIPSVSYEKVKSLTPYQRIVYMGGIYAGGLVGMTKILKAGVLKEEQELYIVTVGLADPTDPENEKRILQGIEQRLPEEVYKKACFFHLRGGIDYSALNVKHKIMMAALCQYLKRMDPTKQREEDRQLLETYGKKVDFVDYTALEPLVKRLI